jgi:hypothetical protein
VHQQKVFGARFAGILTRCCDAGAILGPRFDGRTRRQSIPRHRRSNARHASNGPSEQGESVRDQCRVRAKSASLTTLRSVETENGLLITSWMIASSPWARSR